LNRSTVDVPAVTANHPALAALLSDAAAAAQLQAPAADVPLARANEALHTAHNTAVAPPALVQPQTGPQEAATREPQRVLERPGAETLPASVAGAAGATVLPALAAETQITPAQVSTLQGQPMPQTAGVPQRPAAPRRRDVSSKRRSPRSAQQGAEHAGDEDDEDDEARTAAAALEFVAPGEADHCAGPPRRAPPDAAGALYRRLVQALQAGAPPAGLQELALARRILLVVPTGAPALAHRVALHLMWVDPRGAGRARRYAARGAAGAGDAVAQGGWRIWRLHRDLDRHGEPRLVVSTTPSGGAGPAVNVRLAGVVLPPPLGAGSAAWLDIIDTRRLLHDLGTQWSVVLLWAPGRIDSAAAA